MRLAMLGLSRLVVLSSLLSLTGCVPAPLGKYYKPVYSDSTGVYSGDQCGGKAGAPASLTVALAEGVTLNVNAWRNYGEQGRTDRPLHITIQIPKDVEFQFRSSEIRVGHENREAGRAIPTRMHVFATVMVSSDTVVDMQKIAPTPFSSGLVDQQVTHFSASTALDFSWKDDFVPSSVLLDIPAISIVHEIAAELPPTRLIATAKKRPETYPGQYKSSSSLTYVTKESEAALAKKYRGCKENTPNLQCEQILLYDEGRFSLAQAGFEISGRLYVFDVASHSPFSGELDIKYGEPMKWKFQSNEIKVTDRASLAERTYRFDRFPLYLGYEVSLNTPVRGVSDSAYRRTTELTINSSLGTDDLPKYFLTLPPVLINGKPHEIKPIELERRLFDFGVEPFNC